MKKALLLLIPLLLSACVNPLASGPKPTPVANDETKAVTAAKALYDSLYKDKTDQEKETLLASGPCLSNNIYPDWVADIAHQPRIPADDDPKNQCSNYPTKAHHFLELDQYGNFLRAQ